MSNFDNFFAVCAQNGQKKFDSNHFSNQNIRANVGECLKIVSLLALQGVKKNKERLLEKCKKKLC